MVRLEFFLLAQVRSFAGACECREVVESQRAQFVFLGDAREEEFVPRANHDPADRVLGLELELDAFVFDQLDCFAVAE